MQSGEVGDAYALLATTSAKTTDEAALVARFRAVGTGQAVKWQSVCAPRVLNARVRRRDTGTTA